MPIPSLPVSRLSLRHLVAVTAVLVSGASACARTDNAQISFAIVNARVWTGDSLAPWAEAIAVSGEHISAVGTSAEVRDHLPASARVIDAKGAMVTPSFIDAHVHFNDGGYALASVQLRDAKTRAEFIQRIACLLYTSPSPRD